MAKIVVVNADDFGFSSGVNRGIVTACLNGLVTSVSLMMNATGTDEAVALAVKHELDVGVHVNLSDGRPVDQRTYQYLTRRDGRFVRMDHLAMRLACRREAVLEARNECYAQIAKCVAAGIQPSHLDSHKYVQVLPGLGKVFTDVASEFGIGHVRNLQEIDLGLLRSKTMLGMWRRLPSAWQVLKSFAISGLACVAQRNWPCADFRTTEHFLGIGVMDFSSRAEAGRRGITDCMRLVEEGTTEIMCHPGIADAELAKLTPYTHQREQELQALIDPRTKSISESLGLTLEPWKNV